MFRYTPLFVGLVACGEAPVHDGFDQWTEFTEVQAVLDDLPDDFTLMNAEPFPSEASEGRLLNVWANALAREAYDYVHIDGDAVGGKLPTGAMIVRELREADGTWVKYTVIVQQPEGSMPDSQDMWFGETDGEGTLQADVESVACFSCHAGRADFAYLYGVPTDYAR